VADVAMESAARAIIRAWETLDVEGCTGNFDEMDKAIADLREALGQSRPSA
jgi:hypothetical protein